MADHEFTGTLSVTDKIGIGTKEPVVQLHVSSSTDAPSKAFLESDGALLKLSVDASGAAIGTDNALPLNIQAGKVTISGPLSVQDTLTVSGNVGIGTTSPSHKLAIAAGDINIDDSRALRQAGRWVIGGDSNVLGIGSSDPRDGRDIRFDPGFAGALTIKKDTGNVGIGTTSPSHKLAIAAGDINIDDSRALRQAGRWVIGGDSNVLGIGSSDPRDGRDIRFDPGFAGALTIKKDTGNVGIGTISTEAKLHIHGSLASPSSLLLTRDGGGPYMRFGDNGRFAEIQFFAGSANLLHISDGTGGFLGNIALQGNVGIGTVNPQYPIHLSGGARCTGTVWEDASSREYKKDVAPLTLNKALETLAGLNPVTFKYKVEEDKNHVGFIAEEVPELLVSKDRKGLSPMDIVGILTKVVQHQQKEIEEFKARLT